MKRFTKWLVRHRVLVVIICVALMIPSVLGMAATKTKYDLLYYLPEDLETIGPHTFDQCPNLKDLPDLSDMIEE